VGSPLELKRRKTCPVGGKSFMLVVCSARLLLIHLSLPEFNVQRPFRLKVRTMSQKYIPKVPG
jgi:hypothetical protein